MSNELIFWKYIDEIKSKIFRTWDFDLVGNPF